MAFGIEELFNPGTRHREEEKARLQAHREEVGDASGGRKVDFTTGKVTIRVDPEESADDSDDAAEQPDPDGEIAQGHAPADRPAHRHRTAGKPSARRAR